MMELVYEKKLCNTYGVSGFESDVAQIIYECLKNKKYDDLKIDNVGNVILFKKGSIGKKKIMISAHMDEVGFQVIDKISDHKYKIKPLGNIKTWNAFQQRVESFHAFGVIRAFDEENLRAYNYENIYCYLLSRYFKRFFQKLNQKKEIEMDLSNATAAFLLTLFAGLATGIGGATVFFSKRPRPAFLSVSLGFSAGVMIYVSLIEIFPKARQTLSQAFLPQTASWLTVVSFFAGMALIMFIDTLIPEEENPHEIKDLSDLNDEKASVGEKKLLRMGLLSALAIGIHNFPEGLATFMSSVEDPKLGVSVAIAIAVHNIPEGISVAVPVLYATADRRKAFGFALLSGLAEPVGGLIAFALLFLFALQTAAVSVVFGTVFAAVAGIMVYISIDELLPTAEKYGKHHYSIYGMVAGMVLMAVSLLLFG